MAIPKHRIKKDRIIELFKFKDKLDYDKLNYKEFYHVLINNVRHYPKVGVPFRIEDVYYKAIYIKSPYYF